MVHHSKQRSVSGQRAAIISARNGLRVSLTMYAPRWLALSAFIASPHNLKLNDVQLLRCCVLTSGSSTKKVNDV
jgi:hypothetical protein